MHEVRLPRGALLFRLPGGIGVVVLGLLGGALGCGSSTAPGNGTGAGAGVGATSDGGDGSASSSGANDAGGDASCVTNPNLDEGDCFRAGVVTASIDSLGVLTLRCTEGTSHVAVDVADYAGEKTYTGAGLIGGSSELDRPEFHGACTVEVKSAATGADGGASHVQGSFACPCVEEDYVNGTSGTATVQAHASFDVDVTGG